MIERIKDLIKHIENVEIETPEEFEKIKIKYLGKKGIINDLFIEFKNITPELKKETGHYLNSLKSMIQEKLGEFNKKFSETRENKLEVDLSLPSFPLMNGSRHPISITKNEILEIFSRIGFTVSEGPEIEDDWHVFSALNFAANHPARDMQDTFFIEKDPDILLRTHTSSVQVRVMEKTRPPIRTVSPGRVFRNEAISARAHCIFHQVEGLYIDHDVSFADLKQCLLFFAKEMFGEDSKIRLRPSYFPFTEPSAEMDVSCNLCHGKGCNVCKYTGWLEVLGCGMVHPKVLEYSNINSNEYTGFAFGMGIERIAMLKYQIRDLRLYFENDIRFLRQFSGCL